CADRSADCRHLQSLAAAGDQRVPLSQAPNAPPIRFINAIQGAPTTRDTSTDTRANSIALSIAERPFKNTKLGYAIRAMRNKPTEAQASRKSVLTRSNSGDVLSYMVSVG